MEHKAFLFEYDQFEAELLPVLLKALQGHECSLLIAFIQHNIECLCAPYEGEPLTTTWESMMETKDAHQYGDFALTKYYNPTADIGLGLIWQHVQKILPTNQVTSPVLGSLVGADEPPFDPGKMGPYFQSHVQVFENCQLLQELRLYHSTCEIDEAVNMLEQALQARKGLYVTF